MCFLKDESLDVVTIDVVSKWITFNRLMINSSKEEFLWCILPRQVLLVNQLAFVLRIGSVDISSVMSNFSAFFDVKSNQIKLFLLITLVMIFNPLTAVSRGPDINFL